MVNKMKQSKLAFLIFYFLFLQSCGGLFYFPDSRVYVDVQKLDIKPEQVELKTNDNTKFFGWYFKASGETKRPRGKILFFHGNAQNRTSHFFALYWILQKNYDFFIFDYPGYGESEGNPSRETTADAGTKALEWLAAKDPSVPLIIFGQSLGGNIAMYTASKNKGIKICMVTVESTFRSYRKVAQRMMAKHWFLWPFQGLSYVLVGESSSAQNHISELAPTPLVIFHGEDDPVVGIENSRDIFDEAKEPKIFYSVPGHGHTMAFNGPHQEEFRNDFLKELEKNCGQK